MRDHEGRFRVLEDNVRTPSGIAYAVAARELMRARLPEPAEGRAGSTTPSPCSSAALHAAAPEGRRRDARVVVLSDGPENTAWWEHCAIAERLRVPLVELGDLDVAGDGLYARSTGARCASTSSTGARTRTA